MIKVNSSTIDVKTANKKPTLKCKKTIVKKTTYFKNQRYLYLLCNDYTVNDLSVMGNCIINYNIAGNKINFKRIIIKKKFYIFRKYVENYLKQPLTVSDKVDNRKKIVASNEKNRENVNIGFNNLSQPPRRLVLHTPFLARSTISYGLIVYALNTKRWAIIQRKHSVEFLLFMRGLYRLSHLPLLLSCITISEAEKIYKCIENDTDFFTNMFLNELNLEASDLNYAIIRFFESKPEISHILKTLNLSQNTLKWTWPKGRLHFFTSSDKSFSDRETPFSCANREFFEEVEIILPAPLFISDNYLTEVIHTITGRVIESRYWIYVIPHEIPMSPITFHTEVANRQWVDTNTCAQLLHFT